MREKGGRGNPPSLEKLLFPGYPCLDLKSTRAILMCRDFRPPLIGIIKVFFSFNLPASWPLQCYWFWHLQSCVEMQMKKFLCIIMDLLRAICHLSLTFVTTEDICLAPPKCRITASSCYLSLHGHWGDLTCCTHGYSQFTIC